MIVEGNVWKVGDNIGATDLVPSRYDKEGMSHKWDVCATHLLEEVEPGLASAVKQGDILVAGENLGTGHAHYYMAAIMASRSAGLSALLGESIAALFFRAAIDAGLTAWAFPGLSSMVETGDRLWIDLRSGEAKNLTTATHAQFEPVSELILDIIAAGGSNEWALSRVRAEASYDKGD